jgi:hypothetical protein
MTGSRRASVSVAIASIALLVVAAAAADNYSFRLTAADQAAARTVVIHRADLGTVVQWKGGLVKPDRSRLQCPHYNPKQSDLVVTGAAEADWTGGGVHFESSATIFLSEEMLRLDWQRSETAALLPCLRATAAGSLAKTDRLVSVQKIAFPTVATFTDAIRTLVDVTASGKTVRVMIDTVVIGRGRTEIGLVTVAPYVARAPVEAAETRLATLLANRAPAL